MHLLRRRHMEQRVELLEQLRGLLLLLHHKILLHLKLRSRGIKAYEWI